MESNKDEASKCISIAKVALGTGDYAKALRFAEKSIRLYPTSQAEQLVTLIKNQSKNEPNKQTSSPRTSSSSSASHKQASGSEPTQERKYTAEQVRAVKTILACGRDYYKVLAVEKTATDAQIKKAYRKQALQFHPDKNSAPGADEAFKLVAKAFDVLSDSNKRAIHDQGGDAEMSRGRSSGYQQRHHSYAHNRRYGEEVSPEDIFNMFFGGGNFGPGYRAQQQHHHRQRRYQQQQQDDLGFGGLAQMMPIIFLVLVAIFALLFSVENEPLYTFYPTATNNHLRSTKPNHVNYYVNPKSFDTQFKNNGLRFKRTENQIESDWLHELRVGCQSEQRLHANLLAQANGLLFGLGRNEQAYKRAENMKLEKCDDYRKLAAKIGRWG